MKYKFSNTADGNNVTLTYDANNVEEAKSMLVQDLDWRLEWEEDDEEEQPSPEKLEEWFQEYLVSVWGEDLEVCGWNQGYLPDAFKEMDPGGYESDFQAWCERNDYEYPEGRR